MFGRLQGQEARDHWNGRVAQCGHLGKRGTGETRSRPDCLGTALVRGFHQIKAQISPNRTSNENSVDPKLSRHLNTVLECLRLGSSARAFGRP